MNRSFLLPCLALFGAAAELQAGITYTPSGGTEGAANTGVYIGEVTRRVINGDTHYYLTDSTGGVLHISPPEASLSNAEEDLLADCDRENDDDNYVEVTNAQNPGIKSVGTGGPYPSAP